MGTYGGAWWWFEGEGTQPDIRFSILTSGLLCLSATRLALGSRPSRRIAVSRAELQTAKGEGERCGPRSYFDWDIWLNLAGCRELRLTLASPGPRSKGKEQRNVP